MSQDTFAARRVTGGRKESDNTSSLQKSLLALLKGQVGTAGEWDLSPRSQNVISGKGLQPPEVREDRQGQSRCPPSPGLHTALSSQGGLGYCCLGGAGSAARLASSALKQTEL